MLLRSWFRRWTVVLVSLLIWTVAAVQAFGQTPPRVASPQVAARLLAIDKQLHAGAWLPARASALLLLEEVRTTLVASDLAAVVARLALADAGLGNEETAVWRWQIAQNLDRPASQLATFGAVGEVLARHPLRRLDAAPAGLSVLAQDAAVKPARMLQGTLPKLSHAVAVLPVPKTMRLQAIIDAEGRLREPILVAGGVPGMIYEMLEGLQDWRYEPARKGEQAVAVFRNLTLNPSAKKPLATIVRLPSPLGQIEGLLRAGKWKDAREQSQIAWARSLNSSSPWNLATILALRAVAESGLGMEAEAVCRWQAAQHLNPTLYDVDLAPYGTAGALLEKNRWGDIPSGPFDGTAHVLQRRKLAYPSLSGYLPSRGEIQLAATIGPEGAVRQPLLLQMAANDKVLLRGLWPEDGLETTTALASQLLAVSTLNAVCDWRLRPEPRGTLAMAQTLLTVPYHAVAMPSPLPGSSGLPYSNLPPGSTPFARTPGRWMDPRLPSPSGIPDVIGPSPFPPH